MKNKILNISVSVLLLILSSSTLQAQDNDQCFKCHSDLDDAQTNLYKTDIHHLKELVVRVATAVMQHQMTWKLQ